MNAEDYGKFSKRKFKKLPINNKMRGQIGGLLAQMELADPDPAVRLASVNAMLEHTDPAQAELFTRMLSTEQDPAVREAMQAAVALAQLSDPDPASAARPSSMCPAVSQPGVRNGSDTPGRRATRTRRCAPRQRRH